MGALDRRICRSVLAAACGPLAGCVVLPQSPIAVPNGTIAQVTTDAAQYRSPQPRDVGAVHAPITVTGVSCRTMISFPPDPPSVFLGSNVVAQDLPWQALAVTFGDDGYAAAVAAAREAAGPGRLFDVRADVHTTAVLGVWRRECIEVHALVAKSAVALASMSTVARVAYETGSSGAPQTPVTRVPTMTTPRSSRLRGQRPWPDAYFPASALYALQGNAAHVGPGALLELDDNLGRRVLFKNDVDVSVSHTLNPKTRSKDRDVDCA